MKCFASKTTKGFTLIELLVVIGIIAVLSVVVIITLNPAELLRQARDSTRISDLNTLKSAISLFLADVATSTSAMGTAGNCYLARTTLSVATSSAQCTALGIIAAGSQTTSTAANINRVNGGGWIPVNFGAISSGSPIGALPIDPLGSSDLTYYYAYATTSTVSYTFKLATRLESTKFAVTNALPANDGGNSATAYEVGTNMAI